MFLTHFLYFLTFAGNKEEAGSPVDSKQEVLRLFVCLFIFKQYLSLRNHFPKVYLCHWGRH